MRHGLDDAAAADDDAAFGPVGGPVPGPIPIPIPGRFGGQDAQRVLDPERHGAAGPAPERDRMVARGGIVVIRLRPLFPSDRARPGPDVAVRPEGGGGG